jgi:hypothetical protein
MLKVAGVLLLIVVLTYNQLGWMFGLGSMGWISRQG